MRACVDGGREAGREAGREGQREEGEQVVGGWVGGSLCDSVSNATALGLPAFCKGITAG